jgi:hypothetical protein
MVLVSAFVFGILIVVIEYFSPFSHEAKIRRSVHEGVPPPDNPSGWEDKLNLAKSRILLYEATPVQKGSRTIKDISRAFFYTFTLLMGRGEITVRGISGRVLVAGIYFCMLVVLSLYTANLTAYMTVQRNQASYQTIGDIARATFPIGFTNGTAVAEYIRTSVLPDIASLRSTLILPPKHNRHFF